jgi:adenylate cyclase
MKLKFSLSFTILSIFLLGTVSAIIFTSQYKNDTISSLSKTLLDQLNQNIIETTSLFLNPAAEIAETSARLVEETALNPNSTRQIEDYFKGAIKPHPHINALMLGDKLGNFFMVKRMPDGSLMSKLIYRTIGEPGTVYKRRNLFGDVIEVDKERKIDYDPRNRPWFIGAQKTGQRFWTDVYIFFTAKKPGLTAAFPTYKNNKFMGVFGVDIELDRISELIERQKVSPDSIVMIINDKNKVVAYPGLNSETYMSEGSIQPLSVNDLNNELINEAMRKKESSVAEQFKFDFKQSSYFASVKEFPESFGKEWRIVLIVPEKDLLQSIGMPRTTLYIFLVFLILCVIGLNKFAYKQIVLPLRLKEKAVPSSSAITEINEFVAEEKDED